jgi:hypothetical protein
MNTSRLLKGPAVIAASLLIVLFFIIAGFIITPPRTSAHKPATATAASGINQSGNNYRLHKTLDIKQLLAKSKSNKLRLDVYPVKQTPDVNKKDFDLLVVPRNKEGKPVMQSNKGAFEKGSANYAAFLHKKNIPPGTVSLGYQVILDELQLKGNTKIHIFIDVLQPSFSKVYMSTASLGQSSFSDSAPIGKCPPACFYDPSLSAIIAKEFQSTKP